MEFTYENIGTTTYLVYDVKDTDKIDSLTIGMLTNNKIPGISQVLYTQMDEKKAIKYNVSSKVSASQVFAGTVDKKHLIGILRGVVNAFISAEEYMMDASSILFDWDYIFTNVSTGETNLICVPLIDHKMEEVDIQKNIKDLMNTLQFKPHEDCTYIATILNYLNTATTLNMAEFKTVLDAADKSGGSDASSNNVYENPTTRTAEMPYAPVQQMGMPQTTVMPQAPAMQQPVAPQMGMPQAPAMQQPVAPQMGMPQAPAMQQPAAPAPKPAKKKKEKKAKKAPAAQSAPFAIPGQTAPGAPGQMAVPGMAAPAKGAPAAPAAPKADPNEQQISLFYLLQHYNKDNAATYKRQKAERKAAKAQAKQGASMVQTVPGAPSQKLAGGNYGVAPQMGMPQAPASQAPAMQQPVAPQMGMPQAPAMQQPVAPQMGMPQAPAMQQPVAPQPTMQQPVMPQPVMMGGGMSFGETTVLDGSNMAGETTVLGAESPVMPFQREVYIVRKKNGEKIRINKPVFRIGKEKSYVDYYIGDNTAISRSHAEILQRGDDYYIVDTNSTNHTYVNDLMLQSNVEAKLENGTHFKLANENFEMVIS